MLKLVLLAVCVTVAFCKEHSTHPTHPTKAAHLAHSQPTHPTHPTHPTQPPKLDSHVHDSYRFEFDEHSGYMILNTHDTCYLWKLSDSDVALVKDPATLTTLEAKMFSQVGDGSSATQVDRHTLDHHVASRCAHHHIMELGASA